MKGKLYICHSYHSNDFVYVENLTDFFRGEGIEVETIVLPWDNPKPELLRCLTGDTIGILGFNVQLDHSWIGLDNFVDLAARANVPVINQCRHEDYVLPHEIGTSGSQRGWRQRRTAQSDA
jgi:ABC-type uncharacterized transport system substrate-binding protein